MSTSYAGPGGITEYQARTIRFETSFRPGLIISTCKVCKHMLLSDELSGERMAHHNRIKAQHRDRHYQGLFPNDTIVKES